MKSPHHTKGLVSIFISLTLLCALPSASVFAQQPDGSGRRRAAAPPAPARPSDDRAAEQRAQAINLLIEAADGARAFNDLAYRARIQALAADALWPFDETRARRIFRRAWEAAAAADRAEERASEEAAGIFSDSDETTLTAARDEVLSKVVSHDPKLAEIFLREMLEAQERAESARPNQATRRTPWRELSPLGARRLALAYELLNRKEYFRAAAVVDPLLGEGVSGDLMEFILRLRGIMGEQPDPYSLYRRLVERTAANPNADANDLLLLSSYIVSPQLLVVVDEKGSLQFRSLPSVQRNNSWKQSQSVAARPFYNLAVSALLQRSPFSRRAANPVQDRIARYLAIGRLVPFFEQAGPEYAQFVPAMRSQLTTLSNEMEANRRDALDAQFELTSLNPKNASDPLAPQIEELTRASDKQERDRISLLIVRKAAREKFWDRAQRTAYSIEDATLRRAALSFIVVSQIADITRAYKDEKEDDFEAVARFVRRADAPAFASAWGLAQAAEIAARKGDREQVVALLSEAESYAARTDKNSRQRIAAYIVLTAAAARVHEPRAWDYLSELVRAVNSTDDYMGDETSLGTSADGAGSEELQDELNIEADAFRLDTIFATMARLDLDKTLTQAQALAGEIPRSYVRIAAARAALEPGRTIEARGK